MPVPVLAKRPLGCRVRLHRGVPLDFRLRSRQGRAFAIDPALRWSSGRMPRLAAWCGSGPEARTQCSCL